MVRNPARSLFACVALALGSALTPLPADAQQEQPAAQGRVRYVEAEGKVRVLIDGELFTEYVYQGTPKPYFYPIIGPAGTPMTRGWPMEEGREHEEHDHPHHRSMWFAHGIVGGQDFWLEGRGRPTIQSAQVPLVAQGRVLTHDYWQTVDEEPVVEAHTAIEVGVLDDGTRVIDYSTSLDPSRTPMTFGDTKEGTMALRMHPALRLKGDVATGHCLNSEGHTDFDCWGKRAKWVAYWGEIDGKTVGLAIFDHPTNLRHPCWWHARDYGLVAANPFGAHDFENAPAGTGDYTLKGDETLDLRYRFVFFTGDAKQADVAGKYAAWVKETTPDDE